MADNFLIFFDMMKTMNDFVLWGEQYRLKQMKVCVMNESFSAPNQLCKRINDRKFLGYQLVITMRFQSFGCKFDKKNVKAS